MTVEFKTKERYQLLLGVHRAALVEKLARMHGIRSTYLARSLIYKALRDLLGEEYRRAEALDLEEEEFDGTGAPGGTRSGCDHLGSGHSLISPRRLSNYGIVKESRGKPPPPPTTHRLPDYGLLHPPPGPAEQPEQSRTVQRGHTLPSAWRCQRSPGARRRAHGQHRSSASAPRSATSWWWLTCPSSSPVLAYCGIVSRHRGKPPPPIPFHFDSFFLHNTMAADFTSGIFARNLPAWHGEGQVVDSMTIAEAFSKGGANFEVQTAPLSFPIGETMVPASDRQAVYRTDTGTFLGSVSPSYEVVQNDRLQEMALSLSDHIDMDAVVVLSGGRRVAFTGLIHDATSEALDGDPVSRFLVGWLGHGGTCGIGAAFTDVRVVCRNTLEAVTEDSQTNGRSIPHFRGANDAVTQLIQSIDMARQSFGDAMDGYRLMARTRCTEEMRTQILNATFGPDMRHPVPVKDADGTKIFRPRVLTDLRIYRHLVEAEISGLGTCIPGVAGTVWGTYNAITEVLTSTMDDAANSIKKFDRTLFGASNDRIRRAHEAALAVCR